MSRVPYGLISVLLAATLAGCAALAAGEEKDTASVEGARSAEVTRPTPKPTKAPLQVSDLLGSDGRLTVLILGSDARKGVIGTRTDAIIVATIDPTTGRVAMVSLPRDTVNVPIAPGKVYRGRINSLFWECERDTGKTKKALQKLKDTLSYAFDTEIDYYAMTDFAGVVRLINRMGGIDVTLAEPLIDPTMHLGKRGLRLKAGKRHLDGKKALAFSRSRHSDNDYGRSRRQHQVLAAAVAKVRDRGITALPGLARIGRKAITTDMPWRAAPALMELARAAKLGKVKSVVLEPSRWSRPLPGTYTITPRVMEVQRMFDRAFGPVE